MLPFYLLSSPATARDLLRYRHQRLDSAREVARRSGFEGAKFPWTSAASGLDVCPPDWERCGSRQIHISGDVAYAFHNYWVWTGDYDFHADCGVEVLVETARFFRSRMSEGEDGLLHLLDVIGPDEYNIHADDNYYTNFLARWNLLAASDSMEQLAERRPEQYSRLMARIDWSEGEGGALREAASRLAFPRVRDEVCEQYAGFFDLKDIGEIERDANNMPVEKLHAYDKGYQILKQADTVMALLLFPGAFDAQRSRRTFEYYEKRNTFASSLSASVSCVVGLRLGLREHAYSYFRLTALLDVENLHFDRNTHEGIHAACAGGTAMAAFLGYAGIQVRDGVLHIDPTCPQEWSRMSFSLCFRDRVVHAVVEDGDTRVWIEGEQLPCVVAGQSRLLVAP
jgi:kojibiose phosphorylase